jgi:hypothetical protein
MKKEDTDKLGEVVGEIYAMAYVVNWGLIDWLIDIGDIYLFMFVVINYVDWLMNER